MYTENYKTLMKEIKDDINRWRDIPCSWKGRIKIVRMTIQLKAIYRFNAIPIIVPIAFFTELEQKISKFIRNTKKTSYSQSNLEKGQWSWKNQSFWFQTILQSYTHQDNMVQAEIEKHRTMEQDKSPEINPHTYGQPISDKWGKTIQWRNSLFNKWC